MLYRRHDGVHGGGPKPIFEAIGAELGCIDGTTVCIVAAVHTRGGDDVFRGALALGVAQAPGAARRGAPDTICSEEDAP